MRRSRIALFALAVLAAAPAARAQAVNAGGTPATQPSAAPATDASSSGAAPVTTAPATTAAGADASSAAAGLPRYTPPRTLRAYAHVFVAFAVAWVLLFGYVVFLSRKFRRVEEQVAALARA